MRAKSFPFPPFVGRLAVCLLVCFTPFLSRAHGRVEADTVRVLKASDLERMYNTVAGKVDSARRRAIEDSLLIAKYIEEARAAALAAMPAPKKPSPWNKSVLSKLNFRQASFNNWAAGGSSNITLIGTVDARANYSKKNIAFDNRFQAAYGFVANFDDINKKSKDHLILDSKIGYQAVKNLYISVPINIKTQMAPGYNYGKKDTTVISRFMSPMEVTFSMGFDYKPLKKRKDALSIYYSPVAASFNIVRDSLLRSRYGNAADEMARKAFGSEFKASFDMTVMKNVKVKSDLKLFSNYLDHPLNIRVNWDTTVNMTINKYLSADLSANMIYDDKVKITDKNGNTGPRLQFYETFGISLSYTFKNK